MTTGGEITTVRIDELPTAGVAGDGLDEVRAVLARSSLAERVLALPHETLSRQVWEALHATLKEMGATGGSRMGQPYRFERDRRAELAAFIAGGSAPQHERTTAGWVPTPDALATSVVRRFAALESLPPQPRVLEPSAGNGALIRAVLRLVPGARVTAVEPVDERAFQVGKIVGVYPLHVCTFEKFAGGRGRDALPYQLIVMNPPYSVSGNRTIWIDHVRLAWEMLAVGGRLVAIVPGGFAGREDRKSVKLRELLGPDLQVEELPARSFRQSGTDFDTCVIAATKLASGMQVARRVHSASLYRPAPGDPVRVAAPKLTAADAIATPVQQYSGFAGQVVARYVGKCIGCHAPAWSDGANDPRGALGLAAVKPLRAGEDVLGVEGPEVVMCWRCGDNGPAYRRAVGRARTLWHVPAPVERVPALFDLSQLEAAVDVALAGNT